MAKSIFEQLGGTYKQQGIKLCRFFCKSDSIGDLLLFVQTDIIGAV